MSQKYRVGIIGTGGIARTHTRGYQSLDSAEVVAGADVSQTALDKFSAELGVPGKYTDYREMLKKEDLDIVSVCTWAGMHSEATVAAAQAGVKAILCEKPMAVSLGGADAMLQACEQSGTKLAIGHHHRFNAANTEARRLIAAGAIGQPTLIHSRSGGGLTNNGTHAIDRMRYWLSDPAAEWVIGQVERRTDRYERAEPIEDLCAGIIGFAGGARGILESDLPATDAPDVGSLIYGTEGMLKTSGSSLSVQNAEGAGWRELDVPGDTNQFVELIGWIEGKNSHRNEAKNGHAVVEIMMAIYESVRTKGLVQLPFETKASPLVMMIENGTLPVEKPGRYDIRLK
jgi:UDP-N-acetyl-2-amino-2-deoxyglucuronate dehydrogenase